ncbi:hypothetical protein BJV78DRAFT_1373920 [Lactifluus subvellereus]|nr:hypothetical protein BJV78DRAFT_1373920 [Lactifluus subvellereus]
MSEVSTLPTSSYLNHSSLPPDTDIDPRAPTADPAQLLRQAALSSRKLKRRRLDTSVPFSRPLSRSFASTSSISLDYGQEEPPSTAPTSEQPPAPAPAPAPAQAPTPTQTVTNSSPPPRTIQRSGSSGAASQDPLGDDASMREEGEISENEDPPFRPPEKSILQSTTITEAPYAAKLKSSSSVQSRSPFALRSRSPSVMAEDAYQHATPPPSATNLAQRPGAEAPPVVLEAQISLESFRLETPLYVLDTNHVRPGLSLTQKQYDTAKENILDILGYGVPPEYLIECGLSREMIYYVFTELNLRLPNNLDIVGIPPYPPPADVLASIHFSQSTYPSSPSASTGGATVNDDITQHGSFGYPNSIPRPLVPHAHDSLSNMAPQATAIASLDDSVSASTLALSEFTLSVIERQRKQELLARKAVQASRKRKEPAITQTSTSPTASTGDDASTKLSASAVSVEDFLNSIGPPLSGATASPERDPSAAEASGFVKVSSPEPMNVDEIIPGFGRNTSLDYDRPGSLVEDRMSVPPSSEDTSLARSASTSERSFSVERGKDKTTSLSTHKTSPALENVTTRSRSDEIPAPHLARDGERDSRQSSSTPQPTAPIPRRGTKRPVAADFDSEPMSKPYTPPVLSRSGSSAGFSYGSAYHPNPHVRRKMNGAAAGGFASLNSARRCVIDVSDSEDDTSEDETSSTARTPYGSLSQGAGAGGIQSTAGDSALALELEIERMRKVIREREEMKLRKQAMASSRATPVSRESPGVVRASEGETCEVGASSSSSTGVEIARSETGNNKMSENGMSLFSPSWGSACGRFSDRRH